MLRSLGFVAAAAVTLCAGARAATYRIDPKRSTASFAAKEFAFITVHGSFHDVNGTIDYDPKQVAATRIQATLGTATLDTGLGMRDNDLKSKGFFWVKRYPTMTFVSTRVVGEAGGKLQVTGNLTLRGVTKPVVLDVSAPAATAAAPGEGRLIATATTTLNRRDFKVSANPVIANEAKISLHIEAVPVPGTAAPQKTAATAPAAPMVQAPATQTANVTRPQGR